MSLIALKNDGYITLKNYVSNHYIDNLLTELGTVVNKHGSNATAPLGEQSCIASDQIVNNIHYYSHEFLNFATNGKHIDLITNILNDPYYSLIPQTEPNFILAQCNVRKSQSAIDLHVDTRLHIPSHKTWSIQCILALEKRYKQNGGLKIIPRSHLNEFVPREDLDFSKIIDINLDPGDLIIFYSSLYHGTHELRPDFHPGWGLLLTYRAWWCKPQFDFIKMFGEQRMKNFTNRQKTLLGYFSKPSSEPRGNPSLRSGFGI